MFIVGANYINTIHSAYLRQRVRQLPVTISIISVYTGTSDPTKQRNIKTMVAFANEVRPFFYEGSDGMIVKGTSPQGCVSILQDKDPEASFVVLLDTSAILYTKGKQVINILCRVQSSDQLN